MKKNLLALILLFVFINVSEAKTWQVGPSRTFTMPSQVSALVQNGDTVAIDAGVYNSDVARWTANNLTLMGVGGLAHLKANGNAYGGKAIWVITGVSTTVMNIEFSLCSVPDKNGAGIRQEGVNLTVSHCYFHDNENGILAGDNSGSDILIEYTEFYNNGYGDGYSHNLYINHVNSLTFMYNYSHHAKVGHELKSRAYNNYILYNRFANEATGTASREIDLPNGGLAIIIGNEIQQGANSQNSNMVGYGLEGLTNPVDPQLFFVNNTLVNNKGTAFYKAYNNIFAGPGSIKIDSVGAMDTARNRFVPIADAGFTDAANYNYHLLPGSPFVNGGVNPGFAITLSTPLTPYYEYMHPTGKAGRDTSGALDLGAHEYVAPTSFIQLNTGKYTLQLYPNPAAEWVNVKADGMLKGNYQIMLCNFMGHVIEQRSVVASAQTLIAGFALKALPAGIYFVKMAREKGNIEVGRFVKG